MIKEVYKDGELITFDEILEKHGYRRSNMETLVKFVGKWMMRAPSGEIVTFELVPRGFLYSKWDLQFTVGAG